MFNGIRIFLDNTCPLDNLLFVFFKIVTTRPDILQLIQNESSSALCRYLVHLKTLGEKGNWTKAKILWLHTFCGYSVTEEERRLGRATWNVYGSEYNVITRHLSDIQATRQTSKCLRKDCPARKRETRSEDISLRYVIVLCNQHYST